MISKILCTALMTLGILLPSAAAAQAGYIDPGDFFGSLGYATTNDEIPQSSRFNQQKVANQMSLSNARRTSEHALLEKVRAESQSAVATEINNEFGSNEVVHTSAPVAVNQLLSEDDLRLLDTLDRIQVRRDRAYERLLVQQDHLLGANLQQPLHGGAPLAPTGPGGWLSAVAMLGAVWLVLRKKKTQSVVIG